MRQYHVLTIPACIAMLMTALHLFLGWFPVYQDYQAAEQLKTQVLASGERGEARVSVLYDYTDEPNMGNKYGADVMLLTQNMEVDQGLAFGWIEVPEGTELGDDLAVIWSADHPHFMVNAETENLPHERPSDAGLWWILGLVATPLLYALGELAGALYRDSKGVRREWGWEHPEGRKRVLWPMAGVALVMLTHIGFTAWTLTDYLAASQRVDAVRAQNAVVLAHVEGKCIESYCENAKVERWMASYQMEVGGRFERAFAVKGKPDFWEESGSIVPLLYNQQDPRIAYSFSSSEQLWEPYDIRGLIGAPVILTVCLVSFLGVRNPKTTKDFSPLSSGTQSE